jgi:recombination protein RecT
MSVSSTVATRDNSVGALVAQYRPDFAQVLPSHIRPDTFVRLAQGVLRRDNALREAAEKNPGSFFAAILECARLGHEPGTDQYALTHFNNRKTGIPEIVGIEQYQGEIERMYRAGAVSSVKCEVVRANDVFEWSPTRMRVPVHEYDALASEEERGELRGVYAFAEMHGGAVSRVVVMGKSEVMKHKAVARTPRFWEGPWEPSMWLKTSIHELEKFVPTSSEFRREQLRAAAEAQAVLDRRGLTTTAAAQPAEVPAPAGVDTTTGEVVDAEILDPADEQAAYEESLL